MDTLGTVDGGDNVENLFKPGSLDIVRAANKRDGLDTLGTVDAGDTVDAPDTASTLGSADTQDTSDTRDTLGIVDTIDCRSYALSALRMLSNSDESSDTVGTVGPLDSQGTKGAVNIVDPWARSTFETRQRVQTLPASATPEESVHR